MKNWFFYLLLLGLVGESLRAGAQQSAPLMLAAEYGPAAFPLVHEHTAAPLYLDAQDAEVVRVAAEALAKDLTSISGTTPALRAAGQPLAAYSVIIGTLGHSALVDQLAASGAVPQLRGQWEAFSISVVDRPFGKGGKALVVAGSDRRGTAFGVFELSRRLGVSPWHWWADVTPQRRESLYLAAGTYQSAPPTVKYRGIFLNDEDWGLQPWAAQNLDTDIKDIGPNTYARLFELLLRLKANLIWPAMHPSTRAFFHYPGNPQVADRYAILVGTSHAEPMLRNNVDEWKEPAMGPFDYFQNRPAVLGYWEQRVQEAAGLEAIYSLGMRGVHDSGMLGAKTPQDAARMLGSVLADQRALLRRYVTPDVARVPQVFTAYKEVLDVYDAGLKLPDDVTLVWPDDNYGYLSRLSNAEEQARAGGAGVYYHASYWGRPHDYLWLGTTHPALLREELLKAHALRTDRLWVLNVGDLKPLEYSTQLFLDMAYAAAPFAQPAAGPAHLQQWLAEAFGAGQAAAMRALLWEYYDLAFERRPEFMGWSQTEPTTPTHRTAYNHFYYGDEAQRRLDRYARLVAQAQALRAAIAPERADAYYELVYYPVVAAALMNQKFLYQDKSYLYARQNRACATDYARWAQQAYAALKTETAYYNEQLAGGKWRGMMSMHPRDLPAYQAPAAPALHLDTTQVWGVAPEGWAGPDSAAFSHQLSLPTFHAWGPASYFVDVFLSCRQAVRWRAVSCPKWLVLSARKGTLAAAEGQQQVRLHLRVDWRKLPRRGEPSGYLVLRGAGKTVRVAVRATRPDEALADYPGFVEANGYLSLFAAHYSRKTDQPGHRWAVVAGLGRTGSGLQAQLLQATPLAEAGSAPAATAFAEYDFYTFTPAAPVVTVFTLPTHPTTRAASVRYGLSIDEGPMQVLDCKTVGRSEEWKQNVLSNNAQRQFKAPALGPGRHTLRLYPLDPGVVLDRITLDLGGLQPAYGAVPETRRRLPSELPE
ncbi:MAG TPA: glycosyl hydrolase 115 family protein [Hymenobacter sp.]|uniref:glycosyl hydrolase 115 family protein n=1 Tax=Hymenobacter sp. TaxID=1898978 RepID=UPI002D80D13A|nr:glycosyl hydrolase 115 family protein [Hymenobacter sp.]HET9506220.1 glycosyl hydrolase 115 family protein [Hymenobacter sp.]